MIYAAIIMILLYYSWFAFYYRKIFPVSGIKIIFPFLILPLVAAAYQLLYTYNLSWLNLPVIMLIMFFCLISSTGMNWMQAAYGSSLCVLSAYCSRGIFMAVGAFVFREQDFLSYDKPYYAVTLLALPLALFLWGGLRRTILPDNKVKVFLYSGGPLKLVVVYELVASFNLAILNFGRYLSLNNLLWYMGTVLGTDILTLGMLIYLTYQSIKSIELLKYKYKNEMLEQQYDRQLRHYKSYQKYTESFRKFKHDYKSMMTSLKVLIRIQEDEKAIQLIDDIYDEMQVKVQVHKKYSDNIVLDAMLQDLANTCDENKIRYTFRAFVPHNTKLVLLDAIRVFSNITNNAVEACQRVPAEERFIEITSRVNQQWIVLEVVNSYDGNLSMESGRFNTVKNEKENHGMGLNIVNDIVENLGGFVLYDVNNERKSFAVRIHIPQDK